MGFVKKVLNFLKDFPLPSPPHFYKPQIHSNICTSKAPAPGNYSQARVVDLGNVLAVYTAGQTGNIPETDEVVEGGIGPQTQRALENIVAVLGDVGGSRNDIVATTVYMKDMVRNKAGFEQEYKSFFEGCILPARALVEVSEIPLPTEDTIVEISAVAHVAKTRMRGPY